MTIPLSLARRAVFSLSLTRRPAISTQFRAPFASHDYHNNHHEDMSVYPPESFMNPFWGKVLLATILTGIGITYAPSPSDDVYLTRWIALYMTPPEFWLEVNAKHTALGFEVSCNNLLVADARLPPIHRFRYPQSLTQGSPFLNRVGETIDMADVVPKTDKDVA